MSSVTPFDFNGNEVRVVAGEDGGVWFVAKDVAEALGYQNTRKAIGDHCKGVTKRSALTGGGVQEVSAIPEPDVYRLVMRSKLPSAEQFADWVFEEVLPSIRRTGTYTRDESPVDAFTATLNAIEQLDCTLRVVNLQGNQRLSVIHHLLELQGVRRTQAEDNLVTLALEGPTSSMKRINIRDELIDALSDHPLSEDELVDVLEVDESEHFIEYLDELDKMVEERAIKKVRIMDSRFGGNGWATCFTVG